MKEYYDSLLGLLDKFPVHFNRGNVESVQKIADTYESILNSVYATNDHYRRNLAYYHGSLTKVKENLHQSIWGKTRKEEKFNTAISNLRDDINDLAGTIKMQEGFST